MTANRPIYVIDSYCAERFRGMLQQMVEVFDELLERRRLALADGLDFGFEEADLIANLANFRQEELDEHF